MTPIIEATTRVIWNAKRQRVTNFQYGIFQANVNDNNAQLPELNQSRPQTGELWGKVSFDTQLAGSGTRGTAGDLDYLFERAGISGFAIPATSISYTLDGPGAIGQDGEKITAYLGNAMEFAVNKIQGNVQFEFLPGQPCMVHHAYEGLYDEPTDDSSSESLTSDSSLPPICKGLTATVGGATLVLKRVLIDIGNTILSPRSDIAGANGVQAPVITSQIPRFEAEFELPTIATINAWNKLTAVSKIALSVVLGSTSGNIFTFAMDGYQIAISDVTAVDGVFHQSINCKASRESGDTAFSLIVT